MKPSLLFAIPLLTGLALASPSNAKADVQIGIGYGARPVPGYAARRDDDRRYDYDRRDDDDRRNDRYRSAPAPRYSSPAPAYRGGAYSGAAYSPVPACPPPPCGHWQDVQVQHWVPARWVVAYDSWGCARQVLQPAYATTTVERVWVNG